MDSIIEDIQDLLDLAMPANTPEREHASAQLDPLMRQIQETFGLDFVDRFSSIYSEFCGCNDRREFRRGFCAGARLMMEILE